MNSYWLARILAGYIFAIALWPCADLLVQQTCGQTTHLHQQTQQKNPHKAHNQFGDDCSPLCVCHCCHMHTTVQKLMPDLSITLSFVRLTPSIKRLSAKIITAIWEPPRL